MDLAIRTGRRSRRGFVGPDLKTLLGQEDAQTQAFAGQLISNGPQATSFISSVLAMKEAFFSRVAQIGIYTFEGQAPYELTMKPAAPDPELIKGLAEYTVSVDATNKLIEDYWLRNDNSAVTKNYEYSPTDETATKITTTIWQNGEAVSAEDVFTNGTSAIKYLDTPQNTHPYTEVEISKAADGKPTAVKTKVDGQSGTADFSGIGQVLGSTLGRALAPNNQFVQIAAGTVLGVAGQKLAQVFFSSLPTNATKVNLSTAFSNFGISVAGAGAGAVASFLISELGHELGLSGFQEQMFNTTVGGLASGVANKIATDILNSAGTLSFADAIGGLQWGDAVTGAIGNLGPNIASLLGSYLAHELVPAQTRAGAVGGQLLGAIGSVAGIRARQFARRRAQFHHSGRRFAARHHPRHFDR